MKKNYWNKIEKIFSEAVVLPEDERRSFVEKSCGGDESLRGKILDLLREDENNPDFLEEPLFSAGLKILDSGISDLPAETEFAHYKVIKTLGRGGTGIVFLAEDTKLQRRVALKIISPSLTGRPEIVSRFRREARAASKISHPNVAHIYEFGQHEDFYFLAMEFADGKTLREMLAENVIGRKLALETSLQIADALVAAHRNDVTHRDIKPENIIITDENSVKILDFGLAKINTENSDFQILDASMLETTPGMIFGTTAYMSPEQIRGQKPDARTDLWSFGIVLYEMLNGKRPFEGETRSDVMAAILKTEIPPETKDEFERIILKALRKDREERYRTAEDMRDDLRRLKNSVKNSASAGLLKTNNSTEKETVNSAKSHAPLLAVGGAALIFAALYFSSFFFGKGASNEENPIKSIAVLPLVNESGDESKEYLSDGITESLINRLSQVPNLTVKARNSVFQYKGKNENLQNIGENLSVQAVLLGRVIERDGNLTLSLELVDARTGDHIWGERYTGKTGELVILQNEIVRNVSEKIRTKISGAEAERLKKNPTNDTEAYILYLKGRYHWNKRTAEDLRKSVEYYERAVERDPQFALAYSAMADSYVLFSGYAISSPDESFPKAKDAARKALEIDDSLAEARAALSYALFNYDWKFKEAEKEISRAIELNPNYATAYHWNGNAYLLTAEKFDEAVASVKKAYELDPLSLIISADLATAYLYAGRFEEAAEQYRKTIALDDNFYYAHAYLGRTYLMQGEYEKALAEYDKAQKLGDDPRVLMLQARTYLKMNRRAEALKKLDKLKSLSEGKYISPYYFALIYAGLGDKDKAFEWLEKAFQAHEGRMTLIKVDALLAELRDDPRFSDLARRVGLENN